MKKGTSLIYSAFGSTRELEVAKVHDDKTVDLADENGTVIVSRVEVSATAEHGKACLIQEDAPKPKAKAPKVSKKDEGEGSEGDSGESSAQGSEGSPAGSPLVPAP